MGHCILHRDGRFALWSSIVDDVVTPAMSEAEMRIRCATDGWRGHDIDEAIARAVKTGISSRMYQSLDQMIKGRIGMVEDRNADMDEGETPLPVPTREELLASLFAEDGHRESTVQTTDDGLDLIVRTADRDGANMREVAVGVRDGEIALVAGDGSEGLTIDASAIDALISALMRLKPAAEQGEELRREFLRLTDDDVHARIESDVDGVKGTFALVDGAVVRLIGGDMALTFPGTLDDLRRIGDDGAYSVGHAK